uniref:AlNc14C71G4874 protein n=1 Tax=Albugo laibachii Nc14 TaxID=890382 RepID=F0WE09_9STRA|nr:AlNc14C71G4874 [Albugo laibachii Nc14]|eukprot:CCA19438.1 AlNc14C71G4874 [Albugo laibachii Nc14]
MSRGVTQARNENKGFQSIDQGIEAPILGFIVLGRFMVIVLVEIAQRFKQPSTDFLSHRAFRHCDVRLSTGIFVVWLHLLPGCDISKHGTKSLLWTAFMTLLIS